MISRLVLCTSTTGVSPVTVIVSCTPPTRSSASTAMTAEPLTMTPSRLTVAKPASVNVTRVGAGPKILDAVAAGAVGDRGPDLFDQRRAGGFDRDAGSTAPDASLTAPAMVACAHAVDWTASRHASTRSVRTHTRICEPLTLAARQPGESPTRRDSSRSIGM